MEAFIHTVIAKSCPIAWLEGVEYLLERPHREAYNLILGVQSPREMAPADFQIFDLVDAFLRQTGQLPITTVAGTVFPANHYLRGQAKGVYDEFPDEISKLPKISWGTGAYAMRMLRKQGKNGRMNPLREMVEKIQRQKDRYRSAYEINVAEMEDNFEIPTYDPTNDFKLLRGQPCLSHLTFKVVERESLRLTVTYRSHYYVTKTLGNLLGLAQLQSFVAAETGLEVGPLVCHSTHARVDTGNGITLNGIKELASACKQVLVSR